MSLDVPENHKRNLLLNAIRDVMMPNNKRKMFSSVGRIQEHHESLHGSNLKHSFKSRSARGMISDEGPAPTMQVRAQGRKDRMWKNMQMTTTKTQ